MKTRFATFAFNLRVCLWAEIVQFGNIELVTLAEEIDVDDWSGKGIEVLIALIERMLNLIWVDMYESKLKNVDK